MKTFKVISVILLAGVFIFYIYNDRTNQEQASQTVEVLENNIDSRGIKVVCVKDTKELKSGDVCVLYPGEDTTIRKMDGTVIAREDLQIGETVRLQYQCRGLEYRKKEQLYCINKIAFILKPETGDRDNQYQDATYISYDN